MSSTIGGVRIVDMPDLGAVTDDSSVVGEHAGSGRFSVPALRSYTIGNRGLVTPYDYGAEGSTATVWHDDTAALNTAFAAISAAGGGRIYIPGIFYAAGALTVPPSVEIYGNFATASDRAVPTGSFFHIGGSKLILGASGMTLGNACILRNIMVIASSAPASNPTNLTQSQAAITAMTTSGTGINVIGDNCLIDTVQVLGFNYGIRCVNNPAVNRQMWRNIHGDCINCIWIDTGGDMCHIIGAHFWPYLTSMDPAGTGAGYAGFQRNGTGIYTRNNGGSIQVTNCTVFGWQRCYWCVDNSVTWSQCWADGNAPQSVGFYTSGACGYIQMIHCTSVANQFPVRHSVSNGAVFSIIGSSMGAGGPGGSDPTGLMALGVYADGHGPVQCIGSYFNGGNACIWLGPNTGQNIIIGNTFDDGASNLGYIWHVDPAVIPLITKHSNRVVNSTRSLSETANLAAPTVGLYDNMPNFINGLAITNTIKMFAIDGAPVSPSILWQTAGGNADEHIWDALAGAATFTMRLVNDAASTANEWLSVTRTGDTATTIDLAAQAINLQAGAIGFHDHGAISKPTISGSRAGNVALTQLLSALNNYGLVTDSTTA